MMRLNSRGDVLSARVVDPRTSANRSEHSISAPPWLLLSIRKQPVQYFGFFAHLAWPANRMTSPPGPENGAAHSLQRGELGIRACQRRLPRNGDCSSSRRRHLSSDGGGLSLDGAALGGLVALAIAAILRRVRGRHGQRQSQVDLPAVEIQASGQPLGDERLVTPPGLPFRPSPLSGSRRVVPATGTARPIPSISCSRTSRT